MMKWTFSTFFLQLALFSGFPMDSCVKQPYPCKSSISAYTTEKLELTPDKNQNRVVFHSKNQRNFPSYQKAVAFRYSREGNITGFSVLEPGYYEFSYGVAAPNQQHDFLIYEVGENGPEAISGSYVSGDGKSDKTQIKTQIAIPIVPKEFEIRTTSPQKISLESKNPKEPVTAFVRVQKLN